MRNGPNIMLLVVFLIIFGMACSPSNKHRVLFFIFDGVPAPSPVRKIDSLALTIEGSGKDSTAIQLPELFVSNHTPYRDKQCTSCHDPNDFGNLINTEPALCYGCHNDYNIRFTRLHGPVDAGFCSACHLPHMSRNEKLLLAPGNELCYPCHVTEEVERPSTHQAIGDDPCITCHNPHGMKDIDIRPKSILLER